jgi:hypothetical protein
MDRVVISNCAVKLPGEGFEQRFEFASSVVSSLLEFGVYCATYGEQVEGVCGEAAVLCHAQLYATLAGLGPWLGQVLTTSVPMSAIEMIAAGRVGGAAGAPAGVSVDHASRSALGASCRSLMLHVFGLRFTPRFVAQQAPAC